VASGDEPVCTAEGGGKHYEGPDSESDPGMTPREAANVYLDAESPTHR
jgi:hypothetical protein